MKRIRKWLIRIGILLLVLAIVLVGAGVWFVRRPWPQIDGALVASGLAAPAEVLRDKWGIPHIFAENEHDLFFAQGYVHAQDRLWQMEFNRRLAGGTLSEVLGEPTAGLDRYFRTLGLRRVAERAWVEADQESRAILEAYAEGINAYLQSHADRLPVEFTLIGDTPQPWTPADSLAVGNILAFAMALNLNVELLQAQVTAGLGEEAGYQLFPLAIDDGPPILPAEVERYDWLSDAHLEDSAAQQWFGASPLSWGSNNWVVAGNRTATGQPLLANDTHVNFQMPSNWYENGVHGGGFDSVGFTLPGVPLVVLGHNQNIAWGITNVTADNQDLYIEKLDDAEQPTQYEFEGEWRDLQMISETIQVKDGAPVQLNLLLTQHGPIVNDVVGAPEAEPLALRWTLYDGETILSSLARLNRAANWDEFHAALRDWDTLSLNFVYADTAGNIGYQATGRVPVRAPGHTGILPVPGWSGAYEWQGFIPFDELPSALNPSTGFIATANNRITSDAYPYQLASGWEAPYRAERLQALLSAKEQFSVEDMRAIQVDTYSLPAEAFRPYLLAVPPADALQAQALEHVTKWNLRLDTESVGATIYEEWFKLLLQNTVGDELAQVGEESRGLYLFDYPERHTRLMNTILPDADNAWFDDVATPQLETRDEIVRRSLAEAVAWLSEHYGPDPAQWQWGNIHTLTFVHQPLGLSGIPPLESIFNSQTIPTRGGQFTVNVAYFAGDQSFDATFGAAQRMIIDVGDWDRSLSVNSTGQSGHVFHPHRGDDIPLWQSGDYHPMLFSREAVQANVEGMLTLTPSE
ncbi:MAG TPA: penicillin acylase family protein [Anaerolineae bacterium]|nr:penicillin acylase family protein [Anaerolineae bacterium]